MRWGTYSDMESETDAFGSDSVSIAHALGNLFRRSGSQRSYLKF